MYSGRTFFFCQICNIEKIPFMQKQSEFILCQYYFRFWAYQRNTERDSMWGCERHKEGIRQAERSLTSDMLRHFVTKGILGGIRQFHWGRADWKKSPIDKFSISECGYPEHEATKARNMKDITGISWSSLQGIST